MHGTGVLLVMIDEFSGRIDCFMQIANLWLGKRDLRRAMGGEYCAEQGWFFVWLDKISTSNVLKQKHVSSSSYQNSCQEIQHYIDRPYKMKHTSGKLLVVSCWAEIGIIMVRINILLNTCISSIYRFLSCMVDVDRIVFVKSWCERQREAL